MTCVYWSLLSKNFQGLDLFPKLPAFLPIVGSAGSEEESDAAKMATAGSLPTSFTTALQKTVSDITETVSMLFSLWLSF